MTGLDLLTFGVRQLSPLMRRLVLADIFASQTSTEFDVARQLKVSNGLPVEDTFIQLPGGTLLVWCKDTGEVRALTT